MYLTVHATFDLSEIEETMPQQARSETELETTLHSLGDVCCPHTTVLVSPVHNPVYSPESRIYNQYNIRWCQLDMPGILEATSLLNYNYECNR